MDQSAYRKVFRDIVKGWSQVEYQDQTFYIKHLNATDQVDIDEIKANYLQSAISRGIPKQEEVLKDLKKNKTWTNEDERKIKRQEAYIEQLIKGKSQIVLKSHLDQQNKNVEEAREELNKLKLRKSQLMGVNAEDYAEKRSNDHYVIKSFFLDAKMEEPLFPDEHSFNELYADDVSGYIQLYNQTFECFEELNIQKMILQDFYYIYFPFSDDTVGFFGRPVVELTYNQLKLIVYTKIFKSIFENNQHIPEKIKKDPQALLDYGSISSEAKDKIKEQFGDDTDGSTLFNATEEDYEYAGLQKPSDKAGISLHKAAEKKGGSLNMQDLMELSGIPKSK